MARIVKISQLNAYIKRLLTADAALANISVIGEISNFKHHSSGHVYFSLKDERSRLNCFLPESVYRTLRFTIGDGLEIIASGSINVYEAGGSYSLNIRDVRVEGAGNLAAAFEQLRAKLEAEGLFDEKHKKPLPFFPRKIALVTSETGAAVEDMLKIITTRNNYVDILIVPVLVQGPEAATQIAEGIKTVHRQHPDTDVIIVGRGGGSAEDLWAFNEEIVARAIFAARIPVISAVGHEVDVTIADYVADRRAETPTAAAQMAVPDLMNISFYMDQALESLENQLDRRVHNMETRLSAIGIVRIGTLAEHLIENAGMRTHRALTKIANDTNVRLSEGRQNAELSRSALEVHNPLGIMRKGYAALTDADGRLINSVSRLTQGQELNARLSDGSAALRVQSVTVRSDL